MVPINFYVAGVFGDGGCAGGTAARVVWPGGGGVKQKYLSLAVLAVVTLALPWVISDYGVNLATEVLIMSIFAISLGLIMGYAGMVSLGHAAFFGIGAYTVAILGQSMTNTYALLALALVLAGVVALCTGMLFIRTSSFYFLMITLAFGQMLYALAWQMKPLTGGSDGMKVSAALDFGWGEIGSTHGLYYAMAIAFLLVYVFLRLFVDSPAGRVIKGIMENEARMRALGYNTRVYKLLAYTLAGALAGFAGGLYAYYNMFVSPDLTNWMLSGEVMMMVIIGGVGTLFGPVLGSGVFILLQNWISNDTERWPLIMGALLVLLVMVGRGGIVNWFRLAGQYLQLRRRKPLSAASAVAHAAHDANEEVAP
ncbi:MAG: branched-chain amino acid ABC transporter permease [Alicyclobacillus sp.]|nr:branched-chain amino acid ABC transporter permease [Alicyclobacillus sp.]